MTTKVAGDRSSPKYEAPTDLDQRWWWLATKLAGKKEHQLAVEIELLEFFAGVPRLESIRMARFLSVPKPRLTPPPFRKAA